MLLSYPGIRGDDFTAAVQAAVDLAAAENIDPRSAAMRIAKTFNKETP
jgi:hypothetical protein